MPGKRRLSEADPEAALCQQDRSNFETWRKTTMLMKLGQRHVAYEEKAQKLTTHSPLVQNTLNPYNGNTIDDTNQESQLCQASDMPLTDPKLKQVTLFASISANSPLPLMAGSCQQKPGQQFGSTLYKGKEVDEAFISPTAARILGGHKSGLSCGMQCTKCKKSNGSCISCYHCNSLVCNFCCTQCTNCNHWYCATCTVLNYEHSETRVFCWECA